MRITGSVAHDLFTFSHQIIPDWNAKLERLYFGEFNGTVDTVYGLIKEPVALKLYSQKLDRKTKLIAPMGLIINTRYPWFGYSPDGVLKNNKGLFTLLEVKCPKLGRTTTVEKLPYSLKYLTRDPDGKWKLKKKHSHYSQIQLGLGLMGIKNAVLIIYSERANNTLDIRVDRDDEYIEELMTCLSNVFFKFVLPFLYNRNNDYKYQT